jgi:class 3 adenylate cyclase/tetratricopeptide (TPR) repeat protein/ribosomal protein L40E
MKCRRCQHENPPQAKFCLECGVRAVLTCTKCRSELPADAKFCLECGTPVASQATGEPRYISPESYTPKHLAEKILTSKAALEGERKQVTVLFADLKGSMELLADRDPEEARKILDPVLERMMEAVHRYEGTVNQVMGDGIMALFGAPVAHEDHAVRACYAALRIQESAKKYADEVRRAEGVPVRIRVGLNSGEVVVRSIGSDLHMDYTAVGQTTHLAARMEQIADAGTTLLTPATLALAEGFVEVSSVGLTPVKGLTAPIEVYELTGASPVRSRLQAGAARGLTKFVGRSAEMTQLHEALDVARNGRGQVVAVVGEPGVGKSRLLYEFTRSHRTAGCLVVEASSVPYGKATAYFPVIELLKEYFGLGPRDDARKILEKVTGKTLSLDRRLEPSLPALLSLLDVAPKDDAWTRLDPLQRRQRMLEATTRLLLRESQIQPLIVVFEDLHWIDGETQAFLDTMIDGVPTTRMLLLVSYRPEYQHAWGSKTYYRQFRIDTLPIATADEFLDALLGAAPELAPVKRLLIERTEGNPFFLEESVRTLVETGVFAGTRGDYSLCRAPGTIEIPATAQAILAARIDRLEPEDKWLLQAASVVGKDFSLPLLAAVGDTTDDGLQRGLARLQGSEFVYEMRLFPDAEYTFKHALTHEVAYASLLQERRRGLHARTVDAIEHLYQGRLAEHVDRLAHHSVRAETWDKAQSYLRQAGLRAVERLASREAIAYLDQALVVLDHLPTRDEAELVAVDIRLDLLAPLLAVGAFNRRLERSREAEGLAETAGDVRRLLRARALVSNSFAHLGRTEEAVQTARDAVELVSSLQEPALEVLVTHYMGQALSSAGAYREAVDYLRKSVAAVRDEKISVVLGPLPSVLSRYFLGSCLAQLGEFLEALSIAEQAVQIAEASDHTWSRVLAYHVAADVNMELGRIEEAIASAARSFDLCVAHDLRFLLGGHAALYGCSLAISGRIAEGTNVADRAVGTSQGSPALQAVTMSRAADTYLRADRPELARDSALAALEFAERSAQQGEAARARRVLGDIAALHPSLLTHSAEHYYREAVSCADALGMRPLAAHSHLGLGKLHRRTGKREQAQEHLTTATTMYREMGMTYWLDKAEVELQALA